MLVKYLVQLIHFKSSLDNPWCVPESCIPMATCRPISAALWRSFISLSSKNLILVSFTPSLVEQIVLACSQVPGAKANAGERRSYCTGRVEQSPVRSTFDDADGRLRTGRRKDGRAWGLRSRLVSGLDENRVEASESDSKLSKLDVRLLALIISQNTASHDCKLVSDRFSYPGQHCRCLF